MKRIVSLIALLALTAGLLCGCGAKNEENAVSVMSVSLITGTGAVGSVNSFAGKVVSGETAKLQKDESKKVLEVLVEEGDFVEAGDVLLAHAQEEIYYWTDHHWTSYGASLVYEATAGEMDLTPGDFQVYPVTEDFEGTLSSKSGSHAARDVIEIYVPREESLKYTVTFGEDTARVCSIYRRDALEQKDKYTVFFGGNHDRVEIRTTANTGKSLLLLKDSFANCFVQFLLPGYDRITLIDPRYYYGSLDSILSGGVTDVLFLYSADTFLTDTSLADVLRAGAQEEPTS